MKHLNNMKNNFLILYLLFFSLVPVMAQVNPKSGYIITNTGDTIRGTLDFRTNIILSKKCVFQAHGENEFKTYLPGDIEGFRFDSNGKYFVTRRFTLEGDSQLYFAEFMVQGLMNLYCVADKYSEYFFFEREDGELALLTNTSLFSSATVIEAKKEQQEKKKQLGKVRLLLKDSQKAVDDMNNTDWTRQRLVDAVRDYHKDVCTDGSSCMVYEYKEEADKSKVRFKASANYSYYLHERPLYQDLEDETYSGSTFEVGLGVEVDIERLLKGCSIELGVAYSPITCFEHDVMVLGGTEPSHTMYERGRITAALGFVKHYGSRKIQPIIRVGAFWAEHFGNRETRYYKSKKMVGIEWGNSECIGAYLGGGIQMLVDKHLFRLHADLYKSFEKSKVGNMVRYGITAEFLL